MKDKRLAIIFLTVFIDLVGFGIIIPLNPYLAGKFGADEFQVGLLMSIYSLMQFLFAPIWGRWSDRIGRRPIILISLFGAGLAHLGFAFADSLFGLMVARALAGLFGGNISTAMAYIADITPEKDRSKGMGLIGAAFGLGFILGPFIGGVSADLGHHFGHNPPFAESFPALLAAAFCLTNAVFAYFFLPESNPFANQVAHSEVNPQVRPKRESRLSNMHKALRGPLAAFFVLSFLNSFAMAHIEASLFLFAQDQFKWSLTQASFGFAYIGVIMVFTQGYLIRKWMPRFGERVLLPWGLILTLIGYGIMSMAWRVDVMAVAVTFLGLGNGLVNPALNGSISLLAQKDLQGQNMGVAQSLASLARILGPASGGLLYKQLGANIPFAMACLVTCLGFLLMLRLRSRIPNSGRKAHG